MHFTVDLAFYDSRNACSFQAGFYNLVPTPFAEHPRVSANKSDVVFSGSNSVKDKLL